MSMIILSANDERELDGKYKVWETVPYIYVYTTNIGWVKTTISGTTTINEINLSNYAGKFSIAIRYTVV